MLRLLTVSRHLVTSDLRYLCLLALLRLTLSPAGAQPPDPLKPVYTVAGIVNSATFQTDLAPNAIATIFGQNLGWYTVAIAPSDIHGGNLPWTLGGVQILMANERAHLLYVSPTQINFLIPSNLRAGEMELRVLRDGAAGPAVLVTVRDAAPGLYRNAAGEVAATRGDNSYITADSPARSGEVIVLWGTGLGRTDPELIYGQVANIQAQLQQLSEFTVTLNGQPVAASAVQYAGVTPPYAGLYQINLRLPENAPPNPEIRVGFAGQMSPPGTRLPLQ